MNDKATILAVDDTSGSLALLVNILTSAGYHVQPADSGELALASVALNPPDLILLDIRMGGISGLEVCRRLNATEKTARIPIILMSSFAEVGEWVEGLQLGAVDYINKPFQAEELLARVKTHLTLSRTKISLEQQADELRRTNALLELEIVNRQALEDELEERVAARTEELRRANAALEENITEHKRMEAEREKLAFRNRQLQKAESLGRMAGAIAHHFNNQLAVVIGNLELVMEEPAMAAPLENLAASLTAARKAAEVSGLMLTYLGQTSAQREPMDLGDFCRRSLPLLRAALPQGIHLETDFTPSGPVVSGNPKLLQQVLTHLITNAGESIAGGRGSVRLTLGTASPGNIPESNRRPLGWQPVASAYACLEVRDSGCGIAQEDIEKLFDPFYTSKFPGRGLGLPVVSGIVRAHEGVITVESEPGRGSIFRVYLPLSTETVSRPPEKMATSPLMEGANTVLLIEDEAPVRKMAKTMLSRLGYTVLAASDGDEAVELFHRHGDEIRWVLCDLTMPGMDGWTTLSALRSLSPDLPVILTSGYDEGQVMAVDHSDRPNAFLHKPFTRKDLADTIRRILGRFPEGTAPQENRPEGVMKGSHGK